MWAAYSQGVMIGAGLIIAIGAQNAFVLGQGLARRHHWLVAAICTLSDATLIVAGVAGMGAVIAASPLAYGLITWAGAGFLFWYGAAALRRALMGESLHGAVAVQGRRATLGATLAVSLLNPHVYLDTVVMLGGIGGRLPGLQPAWFAAGAASASALWFFGLSAAAAWLAPRLAHRRTWRLIDLSVWAVMWMIGLRLVAEGLGLG